MTDAVIEVRVSLKGHPIKEMRFQQGRITIGRDPDAQVFLDNAGISRSHAVIERVGDQLFVQDLDSANGTFLNDEQVRRAVIQTGDKLRIGKFSLELRIKEDRRGSTESNRSQGSAHEGTMVLDAAQIERLLSKTKEAEEKAASEPMPVGNVVLSRAPRPSAAGEAAAFPIAGKTPYPYGAPSAGAQVWWRMQAKGLAIGFGAGLVAGGGLVWLLRG